jgi:methylated-DNA-[protein]-cysteine S-methyltransferase
MLGLRSNLNGLCEVAFLAEGSQARKPADPLLLETMLRLEAYFAGATADFSDLPLAPEGTPFQHRVWAALRAIPAAAPAATASWRPSSIPPPAPSVAPVAPIRCCW